MLKYAQMAGRANVVDAALPTAHKAPFKKTTNVAVFQVKLWSFYHVLSVVCSEFRSERSNCTQIAANALQYSLLYLFIYTFRALNSTDTLFIF